MAIDRRHGRVQTPELNIRQDIQPAGIPGSTFIRAPEAHRPTNLIALADALSNVNSALGKWTSQAHDEREKEKRIQEEIDLTLASGMTRDQLREHIQTVPEHRRHAYEALDGFKAAEGWTLSLNQAYQQAVQENPSLDVLSWLQQQRSEAQGQLGSPAAQAGFIKATDGAIENLVQNHQKMLEQKVSDGRVEAVTSMFRQVMSQNEDDPTLAVKMIEDSKYQGKLAGLQPEEADAAQFAAIQWAALNGKPKVADALARMKRGGKGALIDDPAYIARVYPLIEAAETKARELKLAEDPLVKGSLYASASAGEADDAKLEAARAKDIIDDGEMASLKATNERAKAALAEKHADNMAKIEAATNHDKAIRSNTAVLYQMARKQGGGDILISPAKVPNKAGDGLDTLTKKEQREAVIQFHEEQTQEEYQKRVQRDGPQAAADWAFNEHIEFYTKNRWVPEKWEDLFNGVQIALPNVLASKGQIPEDVAAAGRIYSSLRAKAPGLLGAMIKDEKTRRFLEVYHLRSLKVTPEQAWSDAARVAERDARGELKELFIKTEDIDNSVKKVGGSFWLMREGAAITMEMREEIQRNANALFWAGVPADKALDQATEFVSKQFTPVNGYAVFTADPNTPADFADRVPTMLGDLTKKFGAANDDIEADGLFVTPVGSNSDGGSWMVMRKDGMGPMLDDKGKPVLITSQDIDGHRQAEHDAKAKDAVEQLRKEREAVKGIPDAARGLGETPGLEPPGSPNEQGKVSPSGSGLPVPFKGSELNDGKIKIEPAAFEVGKVRNPYDVAKMFNGLNEKDHRNIIGDFIKKSAGMNINPARIPWCAGFANAVLGASGKKGTGSLAARSFLKWGTPTNHPSQGDIVVFERGNDPTKGHVGFFAGFVEKGGKRYIKVLGGNQRNQVSVSTYPVDDLLGFRKPPLAGQQLS